MYAVANYTIIVGIFAVLGIRRSRFFRCGWDEVEIIPTPGYTLYANFDNISGLKDRRPG